MKDLKVLFTDNVGYPIFLLCVTLSISFRDHLVSACYGFNNRYRHQPTQPLSFLRTRNDVKKMQKNNKTDKKPLEMCVLSINNNCFVFILRTSKGSLNISSNILKNSYNVWRLNNAVMAQFYMCEHRMRRC